MEIAVIGAGNMGCVYGGNLARIGQSVTMKQHLDRERKKGLWWELRIDNCKLNRGHTGYAGAE